MKKDICRFMGRGVCAVLLLFCLSLLPDCSSTNLAERSGYCEVTGGHIRYEIIGSGDRAPLLCIHGGPGSSSCTLEVLTPLGHDRPLILYDQLGSGLSDHPRDTSLWHLERFVDELDKLVRYLGLREFHLMGHSWGAIVAVEYMLTRHPTGVRSLVLAGPCLSTQVWIRDTRALLATLPDSVQEVIRRNEEAGTTHSAEYRSAVREYNDRFLIHKHPAVRPASCQTVSFNDTVYEYMWGPSEFTATGNLKMYDRIDRLHELALPVLLLVGQYDEARPETMARIQQLIPGSQLKVIPDAAHAAMIDQPEQYNRALGGFLSAVETPQ